MFFPKTFLKNTASQPSNCTGKKQPPVIWELVASMSSHDQEALSLEKAWGPFGPDPKPHEKTDIENAIQLLKT